MPRADPPYAADERTMLVSFLDYFRETMIMKLDGLTEDQARWTPTLTANSLLGLINHLTYVEHWWFFECFEGNEPAFPDIFEGDEDADFKPPAHQTIPWTIERYRTECARSNGIERAGDLDAVDARARRRASDNVAVDPRPHGRGDGSPLGSRRSHA